MQGWALGLFFHAWQGGCGAPRVGLGRCAGVGRVRRRELAACGGGSWAAGECGPHAEKREAGRCASRAELRRGVGFLFFSYSYFFSLFLFQTTPILFELNLNLNSTLALKQIKEILQHECNNTI